MEELLLITPQGRVSPFPRLLGGGERGIRGDFDSIAATAPSVGRKVVLPEGGTFREMSAVEGFVGRAHLAVPSGAVLEDGLGSRGVPSVRHQGRAYGVVIFALEVADIVAVVDGTHLFGKAAKGFISPSSFVRDKPTSRIVW